LAIKLDTIEGRGGHQSCEDLRAACLPAVLADETEEKVEALIDTGGPIDERAAPLPLMQRARSTPRSRYHRIII
jgi:hypothetical protein